MGYRFARPGSSPGRLGRHLVPLRPLGGVVSVAALLGVLGLAAGLRAAASAHVALSSDRIAAPPGGSLNLDLRLRAGLGGELRWAPFLSQDESLSDEERVGAWRTLSLASGEERALSAALRLPSDLGPGSYRLAVVVEGPGGLVAAAAREPLSVGDAANLRGELRLSTRAVRLGRALGGSLVVKNGGLRAAGPTRCKVYLSRNDAITRWDHELGALDLPGLGAGEERVEAISLLVPAGLPRGDYYLGAILDGPDALAETEEQDNVLRAPGRVSVEQSADADPVALSLTPAQGSAQAGARLSVGRRVRNAGAPMSEPLVYSLVLSSNDTITRYDPELSRGSLAALDAGEESEASVVVTIPAGTAPGRYWLGLRLDPEGSLGDDAAGRIASAPLEVQAGASARAQLRPVELRPSGRVAVTGAELPLRRAIENEGADAAPFDYALVLSRDATLSSADREVYRYRFLSGLRAGERNERDLEVPLPELPAGRYRLEALVDPAAEVAESDEDDNVLAAPEELTLLRIDAERGGAPGYVVSAPHEGYDLYTGTLARDLAQRLGWGLVIAHDFRSESYGHWFDVNRPTERPHDQGSFGDRFESASARRILAVYERRLRSAAERAEDERLDLVVEIHGQGKVDAIELATQGISSAALRRLKSRYERLVGGLSASQRVPLAIDRLDSSYRVGGQTERFYFRATGARTDGALRSSRVSRALHFELPRAARTPASARRAYARLLAELLDETLRAEGW